MGTCGQVLAECPSDVSQMSVNCQSDVVQVSDVPAQSPVRLLTISDEGGSTRE